MLDISVMASQLNAQFNPYVDGPGGPIGPKKENGLRPAQYIYQV